MNGIDDYTIRKQVTTLCIIHQNEKILLGMKKRGFGEGKWNGFGGKVSVNETIEEAARREIFEEAGIEVALDVSDKVGVLEFGFHGDGRVIEMHIFRVGEFTGIPSESEEMRPRWFCIDEIPFKNMWPDDVYWFPFFLSGKKFKGKFLFGKEGVILKQKLEEVK